MRQNYIGKQNTRIIYSGRGDHDTYFLISTKILYGSIVMFDEGGRVNIEGWQSLWQFWNDNQWGPQ